MPSSPIISIIIVSYNQVGVLRTTLSTIYDKITAPEIEVIVIDNASKDSNCEMIKTEFPRVRLVQNFSNEGFAKACNSGARLAIGNFLLFVNSDIIINSNPLPDMSRIFEHCTNIGVIGCQLMNKDGSKQPSYYRFPSLTMRFLQLTGMKKIILYFTPSLRFKQKDFFLADFVSGAFLMISRQLFFQVHSFDERYFMYLEDADLCFQVHLLGKKIGVYSCSEIVHLGQHYESILNPFVFYHSNRGQIIFYKNNYKRWRLHVLSYISIFVYSFRLLMNKFLKKGNIEQQELQKSIHLYYDVLFGEREF